MTEILPRPSQDVLARRMPGGAVLVHLSTNRIFELNDTAARVWELLGDGVGRSALVDRLMGEFAVDAAQAAAEIDAVLAHMSREGLIGTV